MQVDKPSVDDGMEILKENADQAAVLLKAMGNQNRLVILCTLFQHEMSVSEMNVAVPLTQSALSQHLAALRKAKLVATRRDSQTIYYRISDHTSSQIITILKDVYCPHHRSEQKQQAGPENRP